MSMMGARCGAGGCRGEASAAATKSSSESDAGRIFFNAASVKERLLATFYHVGSQSPLRPAVSRRAPHDQRRSDRTQQQGRDDGQRPFNRELAAERAVQPDHLQADE